MNLNELKSKYVAILETGRTENRFYTAAEITEMDALKGEIAKAEKAATDAVQEALEQRSAAAARLQGPDTMKMKTNEYLRSIAKGSQNVGNLEVVNDVVMATGGFETTRESWQSTVENLYPVSKPS